MKEKLSAQERKILEKSTLANELKAEVTEAAKRESEALKSLRDGESGSKDELRKLRAKMDELASEQKNWLSKQREYEQKIGKATKEYIELQARFGELDHRRKTADGGRSEIEVLKTKIAAAEKVINDKNKAIEKQGNMVREEGNIEREALKAENERALKNSKLEAKSQNEAYRYKLQYLELSQKEIEKEKKRWQEKEKEYERAIVNLTAELRELKLEHQQAIETHEGFRVNVEAKESSRSLEASSFEIKKQSLVAEHQLSVKQAQSTNNARISQLEREIQKAKDELDNTRDENERLTLALESGSGIPEDVKARSANAYLYEDEPKQTREERKKEFEELASSKPEIEQEPTQEPTESTSSIGITATIPETDISVSASINLDSQPTTENTEETAF